MCIQKIAPSQVQEVIYGCNSCTVKISGTSYVLDTLNSHSIQSCVLSNSVSTFELYTPAINIEELIKSFSCVEKVTLDNILDGVGNIVNSFNTNSNNYNSLNGQNWEEKEVKDQLDITDQLNRIEQEVVKRNISEGSFYPFVFIICIALLVVMFLLYKTQSF